MLRRAVDFLPFFWHCQFLQIAFITLMMALYEGGIMYKLT